jgi:hypothetical protein
VQAQSNCAVRILEKYFCRTLSFHLYWRALISMLIGGGDVLVEHEMKLIINKTALAAAALALFAASPAFAGRQHLNRARLDAAHSLSQTAPCSPFQLLRDPQS